MKILLEVFIFNLEQLKVITDEKFLSAIFIILVGYYLRKRNIVNEQASKALGSILLSAK